LAGLLWTGFRNLPDQHVDDAAPAVVIPLPAITGSIPETREAVVADPAVIVPDGDAPAIVPREPANAVVPTIAPAPDGTTEQASVAVPNLVGLTISGATQSLGPLGLRLVPGQPVFSESIPLNAIADQDPLPGTRVAEGESVRVSLSRGRSPFGDGGEP
jgi:hypothetical protein